MKKLISILLICATMMSMPACASSYRFESESAMMEYLNGMWIVDDLDQDEFYIFQDGQVYQIEDRSFKYDMEAYMDDTLKNTGLEALCRLDYKTVLADLKTEKILGTPYSGVEINYRKGTIVLNKDESNEQHIIIDESSIGIKYPKDKYTTLLKKISDEADFSGAHFEDIFHDTKNNYTVSTAQFWTDPKEYGNIVKNYNAEVDDWELTTQNETTTIYESSKWIPNVSGALIITDTSVTFTIKESLINSWSPNIDWNPTFAVHYTPDEGKIIIIDQDNLSLDLPLLIQYGANAVKNFPGAYDDYMELYDVLASEQGTVSNGVMTVEKTISGLTYKVQMGTDGTWAYFSITANDTIRLSAIMDCIESTAEVIQPEKAESTEPVATEPVQTAPMNEVSYSTSLGAAVSIFDGPSYDYTYVQSVGQDGFYAIVEEAYDSEGNLWGKLKSGLGWVDLSRAKDDQLSGSPISANFAPDNVLSSDHHEVILDNSEYMVQVAFWAHDNLSDVQFTSLQFDDNGYQVAEVLYSLPELTPDKPLVTGVSFPGSASIFGISFTDSSGATRRYAVFTSGRNGELVLEEYS